MATAQDAPEWRKVPRYPQYSVSSDGQLRRDVGGRGTRAGRIVKGWVVREIRSSTVSQSELARKFCVDQSAISFVRTRRHWKHI
jgi:hypothetical protein